MSITRCRFRRFDSSAARDACRVIALLGLLGVAPATAATLGVGGGIDYATGPGDQTTRSALGLVRLNARMRLTLGVMRYDDTVAGGGNAAIGIVDMPLAEPARVQVAVTRFIGDETYRACRFKTGPIFALPLGRSLGIQYVHFEQQDGIRGDGVVGELSVPINDCVAAHGVASWASITGPSAATQGALGLTYSPEAHVAITGELGLGRNASVTTSAVPAAVRDTGVPLIGGPGAGGSPLAASRASSPTQPMAHLAARFMFP